MTAHVLILCTHNSARSVLAESMLNRWAGQAPRFASVRDACVAGVQGEIDNVAIYDRLLRATQQ